MFIPRRKRQELSQNFSGVVLLPIGTVKRIKGDLFFNNPALGMQYFRQGQGEKAGNIVLHCTDGDENDILHRPCTYGFFKLYLFILL